jgi:phage-related protein
MPAPDWGFSQSADADVDIQNLGDGYEVREPKGLNSVRESMSPKWPNLDPDVALQCYNYLKPKLKLESVLWHHPITDVVYKVIPESLSLTWDEWNNGVLEVSFRQDFNPG